MKEANLKPQYLERAEILLLTPSILKLFKSEKVDGNRCKDSIAVSFLNNARNNNYKVPEEIVVAGFKILNTQCWQDRD